MTRSKFVSRELDTGQFVVCCSTSHRLANGKRVSLDSLRDDRWTMSNQVLGSQRYLLQAFRSRGFPPPDWTFETGALQLRLGVVACSNLLAFTSREAAENAIASGMAITILSVVDLDYRPTCAAIHRAENFVHPAVLRFIEILKRLAPVSAVQKMRNSDRSPKVATTTTAPAAHK